jgi:hypothetical protein
MDRRMRNALRWEPAGERPPMRSVQASEDPWLTAIVFLLICPVFLPVLEPRLYEPIH